MRRALMVVLVLAVGLSVVAGTLTSRVLEPSVTIKATAATYGGMGFGSGVVFTRGDRNYILTAAHVVASLRTVKTVLKDGREHKSEQFGDAQVIKVLYENSRKVGKLEMDAKVLAYSDATDGDDLALLEVRKRGFIATTAVFKLDAKPMAIGDRLYHCGSLQGEMGSNSLTNGIISRIGRVYQKRVYDQTNCTAFPGSSGGGVFTPTGEYVGMVTRGAGETFVLYIPGRRVIEWLRTAGYLWVIDPTQPEPKAAEAKATAAKH